MPTNFALGLDNFKDDNSFLDAAALNQKNYDPLGKAALLKTSISQDPAPNKTLTTWQVSDVMQGNATFKPTDLAKSGYNEQLSADLSKLLGGIGGIKPNITEERQKLIGYDIKPNPILNSLTGSLTGGGTPAVQGNVSNNNAGLPAVGGGPYVYPLPTLMDWDGNEGKFSTYAGHAARDIGAPTDTPIVSVVAGTVGWVQGPDKDPAGGNSVMIQGNDGRVYYCCHMVRHADGLAAGQTVDCNTPIGYVGSTGHSTGPHLHFSIHDSPTWNPSAWIDPIDFLIATIQGGQPTAKSFIRGSHSERANFGGP